MAYFEIGYIEQYCKKYRKTVWENLDNAVIHDNGNCWEMCPILCIHAYDCDKASDRIEYKGFNLKKYDICKNDDSSYEPNLLMLVTSTRNYICFYLKIDGHTLIDLRDVYEEG